MMRTKKRTQYGGNVTAVRADGAIWIRTDRSAVRGDKRVREVVIEGRRQKRDKTSEEYKEYRREIVRNSQRKRRALAKKNGICPICGWRKAEEGFINCTECKQKAKEYAKKRQEAKRKK